MQHPGIKLVLRILTIICYGLPCVFWFVSCDSMEFKYAYNQRDADLLAMKTQAKMEEAMGGDTANVEVKRMFAEMSEDSLVKRRANFDQIVYKIIRPVKNSISALGAIVYFKNVAGKVAMAASFFISLFLLIAFRFLKTKLVVKNLLIINLLFLNVFIVDSFFSDVALLWGMWVLFIIVFLQVAIEVRT